MKFTIDIPDEFIDALADAVAKRVLAANPTNNAATRQRWLTHSEAAEYIRKTPEALYKLTSTRQIKYRKKGKANIYKQDDLDAYLESGAIETTEEVIKGLTLVPRKKYSINQK